VFEHTAESLRRAASRFVPIGERLLLGVEKT
jgi:hypothetical protein